jgi:hypothetical protein
MKQIVRKVLGERTDWFMKKNCWDFSNCQRQPGGTKVHDLGVCAAALDTRHHGINEGLNGGRYCWKIAGTLCGGNVQGFWARKISDCKLCEFFQLVEHEQGDNYKL